MTCPEMYYRRVVAKELQALLMPEGQLNWLFRLVKDERDDLDFLVVANDYEQWISVCRGTTRLLKISLESNMVNISAHSTYLQLAESNNLRIYGYRKPMDLSFKEDFIKLIAIVKQIPTLQKHYDSGEEGYFQNLLSRQFGIKNEGSEDFVVIDKEAVIGHSSKEMKEKHFGEQKNKFMKIMKYLSESAPQKFGRNLSTKPLGNEVDFLAVAKSGEVLLIEIKYGSRNDGIYLSPIQIGLYYTLFREYINQYGNNFIRDISDMMKQKREMGLISQSWPDVTPRSKIIPILVIAEYNPKSSSFDKLKDVLKICKDKLNDSAFLSELKIYSYGRTKTLKLLPY